ncbi:uncharacterized protein LOC109136141 [Beta vulgaris subsp. vulgaris]|uniref:uncharacterized protein LOC109136141 n=1 Tax=Beta vulgaris subsp. vulgaris TaxID=3555 RepID=UPI002036CAB7|nr:uncharacterized protein LOC109136141 [Beta vulgaris subsp. vulgaris]
MEFAGKGAAKQMEIWIREEFADMTRKRDRGISNLDEEARIRRELQLPEFNGKNLDEWIEDLEDFVHFFRLNEESKFKAAIIAFAGDAQQWFEEEHRRWPFNGWQEMKKHLLRSFNSSMTTQRGWDGMVKHQNISPSYSHGGMSDITGCCTKGNGKLVVPKSNQENLVWQEKVVEGTKEIQATSNVDCHTMFIAISPESKPKGSFMVGLTTKEVSEQKGTVDEGGLKGCKNGTTPSCFTGGRCGGGFDKVAGEPHGGKFERGGAAECGSGGGPGNSAGSGKFGVGTASYGGLRKNFGGWNRGECFSKGAAAASGSGGGPGYFAGVSSGDGLTFVGCGTCGDLKTAEEEFVKGGSEVSGSGGGTGHYSGKSTGGALYVFAGENSGGGVYGVQWRLHKKFTEEEVYGRSFTVEKNQNEEGKDNLVKTQKVDITPNARHVLPFFCQKDNKFILFSKAKSEVGLYPLQPPHYSVHEVKIINGLIKSKSNFLLCHSIQVLKKDHPHSSNPEPSGPCGYFISKPTFLPPSLKPIYTYNFTQPKPNLSSQFFIFHFPSLKPNLPPNCKPTFESLTSKTNLTPPAYISTPKPPNPTFPHQIQSYVSIFSSHLNHNFILFQDSFHLPTTLTKEELERQWKPGINFQQNNVNCCRGREFSADYYPP